MKNINEFSEIKGYKKAQLLYVLYVLENFTDEKHKLTQAEIAKKVDELRGGVDEIDGDKRLDTRAIGRALRIIKDVGYNVQGVNVTGDDDKVHQETRGNIWLKKEISDTKLQMLIDMVLFASYLDKGEAKDLISSLISLGGPTLQYEKKSADTRVDAGMVYHQEKSNFFKELQEINRSMESDDAKRISFKYGKYKYEDGKIVFEKEREHVVSPYHYVVQNGKYYLIGYNHKKDCLWHYRLDYVKDVKILKENAKLRDDTELKGKSIGVYVRQHPYMFSGAPIGVEIRVDAERLGIIHDTFGMPREGSGTQVIKDEGDHVVFKVTCTESEAFLFAMQYGSHVEILKPQPLRDRVRYHVESMMFNYLSGDGDKYTEAIRLAKSRKILNLEGIDLNGKTKHQNLKNIRTILLSNNNIDNVDFLKKMPSLRHVCIKNNPITDLSPLKECGLVTRLELENLSVKDIEPIADLPIEMLYLGLGKTENLSAVYKLKKLKWLKASEACADYNKTLSANWDEFEKRGVHTYICEREDKDEKADTCASLNSYYPYNLLSSIFGRDVKWVGEHDEIVCEVDKFIEKFTDKEKKYLTTVYKQGILGKDARKVLALSSDEYRNLYNTIIKKFRNPIFTGSLEKFVKEEDTNTNYPVKDITDRLKKVEKNSQN